MGKINRSLANAGLPQIEDWDSWKKSFLKRGRKVKKNLKKGRKQRHGKEATDFIKSVGGAAVALACYICSRLCASEFAFGAKALKQKGGKLHKALPAFLKSTCMKPLRLVHQDSSRCNRWRERWGELEGTTPTVRQLFTVSQLRAVIPDIENSSEWKLRFS